MKSTFIVVTPTTAAATAARANRSTPLRVWRSGRISLTLSLGPRGGGSEVVVDALRLPAAGEGGERDDEVPHPNRDHRVDERDRNREQEEDDRRERLHHAPAVDVLGHRTLEQIAAVSVAELDHLEAAYERHVDGVDHNRQRVLEVLAQQRGRKRQEGDEAQVDE